VQLKRLFLDIIFNLCLGKKVIFDWPERKTKSKHKRGTAVSRWNTLKNKLKISKRDIGPINRTNLITGF